MVTAMRSSASLCVPLALRDLLDRTLERLVAGAFVQHAMDELVYGLGEIRMLASGDEWTHILDACRAHPLHALLEQDPFIRSARAHHPADARTLDLVYQGLPLREWNAASELGRAIFEYTAGRARYARALRERRDVLAGRIDAAAMRVAKPRVLAVASGHLCEAGRSRAFAEQRIGALHAVDSDPFALEVVRRDRGAWHLVYAASLCDHLPAPAARELVASLFAALEPGGELVICNSLPAPTSVGFLEACLGWSLAWRSLDGLASLAAAVPRGELGSLDCHADATESIGYLRLTRRAGAGAA